MASRQRRSFISRILRQLERAYGTVTPPTQLPVLDELVATILSQNTTDTNSSRAFTELQRRFATWDDVRTAPVKRVVAAIRRAGLANQKAPRIQSVLNKLRQERGELSLEFLHDWPLEQARDFLRQLPGVGPKTAACVLLFACRKPILPVDTHVHRVSQRLGLISEKTTAEQAHIELAEQVPAERSLEFHLQFIRHGREVCSARQPQCEECVLLDHCQSGVRFLQERQRRDR